MGEGASHSLSTCQILFMLFLYLSGEGEAPGQVLGALGKAGKPRGGYTANHTSCLEPGGRALSYPQTLGMGQGGLWMSDTELLPSQSSQVWGQHQTSKQTDALRPGECPDAAVLGSMGARAGTTAPDRCFPPFLSCVPCNAFTVCFLASSRRRGHIPSSSF